LKFAHANPTTIVRPNTPPKGGWRRTYPVHRTLRRFQLAHGHRPPCRDRQPDNVFGAALALLAGCHPASSPRSPSTRPTYAQLCATLMLWE
jgi:hypothetical protein